MQPDAIVAASSAAGTPHDDPKRPALLQLGVGTTGLPFSVANYLKCAAETSGPSKCEFASEASKRPFYIDANPAIGPILGKGLKPPCPLRLQPYCRSCSTPSFVVLLEGLNRYVAQMEREAAKSARTLLHFSASGEDAHVVALLSLPRFHAGEHSQVYIMLRPSTERPDTFLTKAFPSIQEPWPNFPTTVSICTELVLGKCEIIYHQMSTDLVQNLLQLAASEKWMVRELRQLDRALNQ